MAVGDPRTGEAAGGVMGQVIPLPVDRPAPPGSSASGAVTAARSASSFPSWHTDDWGHDAISVKSATRVANLRWHALVGGVDRLPKRGAGLVVINSRRFGLTPWFVALELGARAGRPVRFVGRADTAPFGALARRLGGLLARPDEMAGALRHGQLLVLGAAGQLVGRGVGAIDHRLVGPAVAANVPVFPAAVAAPMSGRRARIEIARAVRPSSRRRGPLAELELTEQVGHQIARMLIEFGDSRTGTPLDWLPLHVLGGN